MHICLIAILLVVLLASPFCVLPTKFSFEELIMKDGQKFDKKQNFWCTLGIIAVSWVVGIIISGLGDAMTIFGATTNSGIGFLLPIVFYLKNEEGRHKFANDKIVAYIVFIVVSLCSCIEMYTFIDKKIHPD